MVMYEHREHADREETQDAQSGAQTVEQAEGSADQQTGTTEPAENVEVKPEEDASEQDRETVEQGETQTQNAETEPEENAAQEPQEADDSAARIAWLSAQLLNARATAAATALGVRPERVKYAIRLSDFGGIDVTQEDADRRISAAIKQVVNELPELKGGAQGTGTQGAFARQSNAQPGAFERGLMSRE